MDKPSALLFLLNFVVIGALPRVFFRSDGRFNRKWWLTALPFGLSPLFVAVCAAVGWEPITPDSWRSGLNLAAVALNAVSIALIFLTLGTHRIPVALWHQENDAPRHLVTHGAYSLIRHPFYAAFLLAFLSAAVLFPHAITLALFCYGFAALNATAAREEQRLSESEFGSEYRGYLARTGRFLPRPGRAAPAETSRVGG
ncbi:isoprenylcysteine carboxylmethyltransferase family protein [Streptomyces sp. H10-C2]|uniref:methyltransferase family protein n=1 Tax=unclassified Streptomyces TaxID=2593676 RepID=UPI0024B944DE|nr:MULTISPECIES: isoprenylcysteine carboxylmethyltransferase family protein [unclassified Streptomyces]MDJ0345785.1 isoprenylcysteine carboxylmethyltransferase family protein [Streptomyces sp. PH10-H1]MDJ0374675.1 isoprenylcysteine carboxylmethyltransferase family protein [Streptomyces sp. H10-C2]